MRSIASRLPSSSLEGSAGHGADLQAGGAGCPQRQQRMVDRAETGPGGDQHGQSERRGEIADRVVLGER
jgi:hypothetical protein